ncbi:hypothetical protein AAEU29_01615 [Pseudoalteromonas sp. SSM20]|uniref:hypothetical protein n=1 Tax=Pseudoalteromonas sp. SSM20 TaxID=3139394 RepID=UPI003BAD0FAB
MLDKLVFKVEPEEKKLILEHVPKQELIDAINLVSKYPHIVIEIGAFRVGYQGNELCFYKMNRPPTRIMPEHNRVSRDSDKREINWALKTFVERVESDVEIPENLIRFVSGGVKEFLNGGKPWLQKTDKSIENASLIALIQICKERYSEITLTEIGDCIGTTKSGVSRLLNKVKSEDKIAINFHKGIYREMYKSSNKADLLNALFELKSGSQN